MIVKHGRHKAILLHNVQSVCFKFSIHSVIFLHDSYKQIFKSYPVRKDLYNGYSWMLGIGGFKMLTIRFG